MNRLQAKTDVVEEEAFRWAGAWPFFLFHYVCSLLCSFAMRSYVAMVTVKSHPLPRTDTPARSMDARTPPHVATVHQLLRDVASRTLIRPPDFPSAQRGMDKDGQEPVVAAPLTLPSSVQEDPD